MAYDPNDVEYNTRMARRNAYEYLLSQGLASGEEIERQMPEGGRRWCASAVRSLLDDDVIAALPSRSAHWRDWYFVIISKLG